MATIIDTYNGNPIDAFDDDVVATQARQAALPIRNGSNVVAVNFMPGNGTRYVLVFTRLNESAAALLGNEWLLSIPSDTGGTCYPIGLPSYAAPGYIQQKWLPRIADAVPLSHFLDHLSTSLQES